MSKEDPAWKIPLAVDLSEWLGEHVNGWTLDQGVTLEKVIYPHILAAEQRGFQAGVNKTGDSVGKLREQLKTAKADARREAAEKIRDSVSHLKDAGPTAMSVWAIATQGADLIDPDKP